MLLKVGDQVRLDVGINYFNNNTWFLPRFVNNDPFLRNFSCKNSVRKFHPVNKKLSLQDREGWIVEIKKIKIGNSKEIKNSRRTYIHFDVDVVKRLETESKYYDPGLKLFVEEVHSGECLISRETFPIEVKKKSYLIQGTDRVVSFEEYTLLKDGTVVRNAFCSDVTKNEFFNEMRRMCKISSKSIQNILKSLPEITHAQFLVLDF